MAAFINKGKLRPFDLLEKSDEFLKWFGELGEFYPPSQEVFDGIEKFVCVLYGRGRESRVNDVRFTLFQQNYAPKGHKDPLKKIKGMNPASMPPCQNSLKQKILRSNHVTYCWKRADMESLSSEKPEDHGWIKEDCKYNIKWFLGDQVPGSITALLDGQEKFLSHSSEEQSGDEEHLSSDSDDEHEGKISYIMPHPYVSNI